MELQDIFLGTLSGAAIVLTGALYSLFYALGKFHSSQLSILAAYGSYALLAVAVYFLVDSLALNGVWLVIVAVMLAGYFWVPRAIWQLCVAVHSDEPLPTKEEQCHEPI